MARVAAVPEHEAGHFGRLAYRLSRQRLGEVAEPLAMMAHYPKLLLGYAATLTRTPTEVADDLFNTPSEHFDWAQMVELAAAIAVENYRAWFNHAFGMGSQGFSEGSFCTMLETLTMTKGVKW